MTEATRFGTHSPEAAITQISLSDAVDTVRTFNRFYTNTIGVLSEKLLDSPYTLTEVRVLFELAHRDYLTASHLQDILKLDAGYVSRILARFTGEGLIERVPAEQDRRRRIIHLTERGREVFDDLDERSSEQARELIQRLSRAERSQVATAMNRIQRRLEREALQPRLRPLQPGDLGWVVYSQGKGYWEQFGWNAEYEALVARIAADFAADHDPDREAGWIAELDGEPVGSIFCVKADETTAKLRLLWVEPSARGEGVGGMLVRRCVGFARDSGYSKLTLWTVSMLHSARRLYESAGFTLTEEEPVQVFGQDDLVSQVWDLQLAEHDS